MLPALPPRSSAWPGPASAWCVAAILALTLMLTGCTKDESVPSPSRSGNPSASASTPAHPADQTVAALVTALQTGTLADLPIVGGPTSARAAARDYAAIMAGMDGLLPVVTVEGITYADNGVATATLNQTYTVDGNAWQFSSEAPLNQTGTEWQVAWQSSIVHPQLNELSRIRHLRQTPGRAPILGARGEALMEERPVYSIGLDKQNLHPNRWGPSARALATLLQIDVEKYLLAVTKAGEKAFVPAVTLRQEEIPPSVVEIAGVTVVKKDGVLAPNKSFAASILGTVGEATPEQIKAGAGRIAIGDLVGQSGLQARYDAQLRGRAGSTIEMVARTDATPASGSTAQPQPDITLFTKDVEPGQPLQLTLDMTEQFKAEQVLSTVKPVAAMVVVRNSDGAILASATSPAAGQNNFSTFGRYAPGSTFKIASTLALLRKGKSVTSAVNCPATITVNGRVFTNYSDFPATAVGPMSLERAVATSCNTAFIGQAPNLDSDDLAQAAGSLGLGIDHDAGFPAFYGSVPATGDPVVKAADLIGQGHIEASPMAMAGVAASVASGKTQLPYLVAGQQPTSTAPPLTADEAAQLKQAMSAVVTEGSGRGLQGLMTGAKTGTAEFGTANPPQTHAWMIAWNGSISIAVMVEVGQSGSGTALPLIKAYLAS